MIMVACDSEQILIFQQWNSGLEVNIFGTRVVQKIVENKKVRKIKPKNNNSWALLAALTLLCLAL